MTHASQTNRRTCKRKTKSARERATLATTHQAARKTRLAAAAASLRSPGRAARCAASAAPPCGVTQAHRATRSIPRCALRRVCGTGCPAALARWCHQRAPTVRQAGHSLLAPARRPLRSGHGASFSLHAASPSWPRPAFACVTAQISVRTLAICAPRSAPFPTAQHPSARHANCMRAHESS